LTPKITKPNVSREKLQNLLSYKKTRELNVDEINHAVANFINILPAAFAPIFF